MANLFIIAAPSGCGKTSLVKALLKSYKNFSVSVSHTTRKARKGEVNGENYHFVSKATFEEMVINDEFIGLVYIEDDEGEVSYQFHMTILKEDLLDS